MATVHANKILTKFMLLLGGHNHCVKVSSDSETVRGMGLWEFSGALRELMLICALWPPAGKGLTSWLSFVVSNCEFVTFPLVSWVRCGT